MLYGFTGPEDEPPLATARRQMYTRIGHALATTCFAGTAILIGMVLVRSARPVPPAVVHDARVPELDARIAQQASRVAEIEAGAGDARVGVARAETRLHELAESLNRLAAVGSRTEHRVGRLEQSEARAVAAQRTATVRKPAVAAPPVAAPPVVARTPEPPPAPAERFTPAPVSPAPTPERVASASPRSAPEGVVSPPPAPAPSPSISTPDVPPATLPNSTSMPNGLRAKLRQDWIAIQKGFESSRDDIRRAFDGTVRKLREVGQ